MIDVDGMTPNEIRLAGFEILNRELGPDGFIQFMQQFSNGSGDYTKERHELLKDMTVDSILKELIELQENEEV